MKLSPDLINLLHERAAEQFGGLWFDLNQKFVEATTDQVGSGQVDKNLIPRLAYIACQAAQPSHPNWFKVLSMLELYRNETIGNHTLGEVEAAGAYARRAWHLAKELIGE